MLWDLVSKSKYDWNLVIEVDSVILRKKASKACLTHLHLDAKPGDHFCIKLKGFPVWPAIIWDETLLSQVLVDSRPIAAVRPDGSYTELSGGFG
ncbi:uncharacterized protein FTOL_11237 [Fusarium torulosum]|uniref:PWWP domain-containing protein n=1 Tax=Fusarium torulosum TaxID=33205 RepID=A0AAE8MJJ6_9HYPO|nr:uncharacterized protein FTOL_11237 [Fusarium torulosum]